MNALIIINEVHSMLPEQLRNIEINYDYWDILPVPKEGWTLAKMREDIQPKLENALLTGTDVVFVSQIPVLLKELSFFEGALYESESYSTGMVRVMMRDQRIKTETKDGFITSKIKVDGWRLA
jgi:hypothetical protein